VFNQVKAVVTDMGGMMSHSAIVSREYGIPAVTGVAYGTMAIKTGDILRVDGDKGVVTIVKKS
jgi:pyruvate,water dikinase